MKTVAIVGGGFSGTAMAATVRLLSPDPIAVLLFDRSATFGAGLAYGTQDPHHWLNVPSVGMSAFEDEPAHFVDWLSEHGGDTEEGFATRATYRRYLEFLLTLPPKNSASSLETLGEEVVTIEGEYCLRTQSGTRFAADAVVLATGYPRGSAWGGEAARPFAPETWPEEARSVVIIGSGLTALDAAASVFDRYPSAQVTCVSRHGLVPRPYASAPSRVLSSPYPTGSLRRILRWLRAEVALADREGGGWISVFDAMRPHWETVWQCLDTRERAQFTRHLLRYFESFRHRVPPPLQRRLASYWESGALTVRRGCPSPADLVIDASGPRWDWEREPLFRTLFDQGLSKRGPLGMGIETTRPGLYVVGPPRRGAEWETTAVREIRRQIKLVAEAILAS